MTRRFQSALIWGGGLFFLLVVLIFLGREAHWRDKQDQINRTLESVVRSRGPDQLFELTSDLLRLERLDIITCFRLFHQNQNYISTGQTLEPCRGQMISGEFLFHSNTPVRIEYIPAGQVGRDRLTILFLFIAGFISALLGWVLYEKEKRRLLEREQERLQRESLLKFSRQVAHDIRSPLSALQLGVSAMKEKDGPAVELVGLAVDRINKIAAEILGPREKNKNTNEFFSMKKCFQDIFIEKKQLIEVSGAQLEMEISENGSMAKNSLWVAGSETEMKRILSNLVDNSIQAFDQKNETGLSAVSRFTQKRICAQLEVIGQEVVLTLEDNGPGIPASVLPRLGENGFTYGKAHVGHGLGLSHAKTCLEKMNGRLEIQSPFMKNSSLQNGTQVRVTLPWTDERRSQGQLKVFERP